MQPHEQQVIEEKTALDEKLTKLHNFIGGVLFKQLDLNTQTMLVAQRGAMTAYSEILALRIAAFKP